MNSYTLPDLPYDYNALEPYISRKIMELHHGRHHAVYVRNANSVLEQLDEARHKEDLARLAALERALAFNLSGHILHSIFWRNMMSSMRGNTPTTALGVGHRRDYDQCAAGRHLALAGADGLPARRVVQLRLARPALSLFGPSEREPHPAGVPEPRRWRQDLFRPRGTYRRWP